MAKKIKLILAAFLMALTAGIFTTSTVFAEDGGYEKAPIHLQVSPAKLKVSIKPGSSYVGSMKVMNVGARAFDYEVTATPYSVSGEEYSPNYTAEATYSQMSQWITFDKKTQKGTLQPEQIVDVTFTVNVPNDVPAGGQYAAIMAQTSSGNAEDANIKTIHRVGMILYASVPGETRECAEITKNTVNSFYFNPPITVSSLVKNCGNIEQTATYTVKMYPLFSNEAVFSNEENPATLDIYPDTSRFNSISWDGAPRIGIFKVTQIVDFGGSSENREVTKYVLICPLWLLFVIIALIFFIIFWLVSRARDRKRGRSAAAGRSGKESNSDKEKEEK